MADDARHEISALRAQTVLTRARRRRQRRRARASNPFRQPGQIPLVEYPSLLPAYTTDPSQHDEFPVNLRNQFAADNTPTPPPYQQVEGIIEQRVALAGASIRSEPIRRIGSVVPTNPAAADREREARNTDDRNRVSNAVNNRVTRRDIRPSSSGPELVPQRMIPVPLDPLLATPGRDPGRFIDRSQQHPTPLPIPSFSESEDSSSVDSDFEPPVALEVVPAFMGRNPILIGFPIGVLRQLTSYHFINIPSLSEPREHLLGKSLPACALWVHSDLDFFDWSHINYDSLCSIIRRYDRNPEFSRVVFYSPYNLDFRRLAALFSPLHPTAERLDEYGERDADFSLINNMVVCFPPLHHAFGTLRFADGSFVDWFHSTVRPSPTLPTGLYSCVKGLTPRVTRWSSSWHTEYSHALIPIEGSSGQLFTDGMDLQFYRFDLDNYVENSLDCFTFGMDTQISYELETIVPKFLSLTNFVCNTQNNFMSRTTGANLKTQIANSPMSPILALTGDVYVEKLRIVASERVLLLTRAYLLDTGAISRCQYLTERLLAWYHTFPGGWFDKQELYRNWTTATLRKFGTSERVGLALMETKTWHKRIKALILMFIFVTSTILYIPTIQLWIYDLLDSRVSLQAKCYVCDTFYGDCCTPCNAIEYEVEPMTFFTDRVCACIDFSLLSEDIYFAYHSLWNGLRCTPLEQAFSDPTLFETVQYWVSMYNAYYPLVWLLMVINWALQILGLYPVYWRSPLR